MKLALNDKLQIIAEQVSEQPEIQITCFQPDETKAGGAYITTAGTMKRLDEYERVVAMRDGTGIPADEIIRIDG